MSDLDQTPVEPDVVGVGPNPVPTVPRWALEQIHEADCKVVADYTFAGDYDGYVVGEGFWTTSIFCDAPLPDGAIAHQALHLRTDDRLYPELLAVIIRIVKDELQRRVEEYAPAA